MEFQLSYFKSWKMMLWKCCTQYASKFGKLSSGHRTGKAQFSFQSQRKAMPKNAQTTTQLHLSHTLVKWCLKFSKSGFSNTWTVNFQMFSLVLEKAEEPVKEGSVKGVLKLNIWKQRLWYLVPLLHGKQMGKHWKQCQTLFFWAPKSLQMVIVAMKLKDAYSFEGKLWPT